ncbi:MAG: thioredoxin family protein [bacterium]
MKKNYNYVALRIIVLLTILFIIGTIPDKEDHAFALSNVVVKKPAGMMAAKKKVKSTKDIKSLEEALKAGVPVMVKLGSDKCIPCRMMNPVIKELAVEQDGRAIFLILDVYENRELARQAGVRVIPTILFYDKHGKPRAKSEGGMSKDDILKAVKDLNK